MNISKQLPNSDLLTMHYLESMVNYEEENINLLKLNLTDTSDTISISKMTNLADTLLNTINTIKVELVEFCGGRDEFYNLNEPYSSEYVGHFFINMKYGEVLRMHFKAFEDYLDLEGIKLTKFSRDADEIEIFKDDPSFKYKLFYEYNFDKITLTQTLVRLSIFELYVNQLQKEYLLSKKGSM